jgi:CRISPR-associated DxTHG motif protein
VKIITIAGIGHKTPKEERAYYAYDTNLAKSFTLKKHNYTNMLPLLIDNFHENIIPIFTQNAKESQTIVLQDEFEKDFEDIFKPEYLIGDEKDFYSILSLINTLVSENDKYIIDLTHGFRHIPILATISIITHTLNDTSNIEHILFAKEIEAKKNYEIIDLKEYLELANMSYMLETFADNYTVSSKTVFIDEDFQELSDELRILSNHILSNSLQQIFASNAPERTINNIDKISQNKKIATFKNSLEKIKSHLGKIHELRNIDSHSRRLFEFSKLLNERGYLLNAITLLFEAIGFYCLESFKNINDDVKSHIEFCEKRFTLYEQTSQTRTFVKIFDKLNKLKNSYSYLYNPETVNWSKSQIKNTSPKPRTKINAIHEQIRDFLQSKKDIDSFRAFINEVETIRNNLAHGNYGKEIENAKGELSLKIKMYETFCVKDDILGKDKL